MVDDTEQRSILDYCATDVYGLLPCCLGCRTIDWPRALVRGRYMAAAARMEWVGVPIDVPTHVRLVENWSSVRADLVRAVDVDIGVFEEKTFKADRFAAWLAARDIPWPRLPSGALDFKEATFKSQALCQPHYPELRQLYELRSTLGGMRLTGLQVGSDGRNRCLLSAFKSVTGRNQPSNTKSIFGPATWMRGLIKPPDGLGLAYIDFASQEIGIAAALSGDERLIEAYTSGDPYLSFAIGAGLAPTDANKISHKAIRDRCKAIVLGIGYGMGADAMAMSAGIAPVEARDLLRKHHDTYRAFWRWNQDIQDMARLSGVMHTSFGWTRHVQGTDYNLRSLMNWPIQAGGADIMRIAAIAATESGIEVCLPVHDAFLIQAPIDELDNTVAAMQAIMCRAGAAVTGGLAIRAEVDQVVRPPDRYMDKRGVILKLPHVDSMRDSPTRG